MIQLKQSEFRLPGLERHTEKIFPFYLNHDKPCGELALGENCIKIISQDKSNSLGVFLEIQRDTRLKCHVTASFMLICKILLFIGPRKKYCFAVYLSCCVSLNQCSESV